jgi:hypothetical protein
MKAENGSQTEKQTKLLTKENMNSRRAFLKRAVKKCAAPAIIIYSAHKMSPPAFGRSPI